MFLRTGEILIDAILAVVVVWLVFVGGGFMREEIYLYLLMPITSNLLCLRNYSGVTFHLCSNNA